ncbi:MAG: hypothetical protein J7K75_00255 [Desulfuromonas sp.]|nr:hypothetical protein [Desulfuromonas sp.]
MIVAVKGKARKDLPATAENRAEILKLAMGPSGNLRAPTFKVADNYIVGFNEQMYEEQLLG